MSFLHLLGLKKAPSPKQLRTMLPALHSFVDVAVKDGPKGSVCFENAGPKTFLTSAIAGMAPGAHVSFLYSNAQGRYRFKATLTTTDGKQATFAMPAHIETVQTFTGAHQRTTIRLDTTISISWRYERVAHIESPWKKAVASDVSRTGCSLAVDKPIKVGSVLDLKLPLRVKGGEVEVRAEAMRVEAIDATTRFNVGLKFAPGQVEAERAVVDYINRRQTDLRGRGLA